MDEPSSEAIRSLLTALFPLAMVEDLTREIEVVCDRKIDVRMLVWSLVVGFAVAAKPARSLEATHGSSLAIGVSSQNI